MLQQAGAAAARRRGVPATPRRALRRRLVDAAWAYALISPLALGLGVFYVWPAVRTLYFSFTEWGPFGGYEWTGLDNYRTLLTDPAMPSAVANSFLYAAVVLLGVPISIALAALINQRGLRGKAAYRTLFFLPVVTMPAAVAIVWGWLYHGDYGLINYLLSLVGVDGQAWLANPDIAIYAVAGVALWMEIGYSLVIFLAGLQGVPRDYYEAAALDGAGPIRQFFSVTVPLLTPSIFFVTVLSLIQSLQAFDLIYVMLGPGNPATASSRTIVYLFYEKAFLENDRGYGASVALALLVLIGIITAVQFRMQKKWVHYA